ncbi:hypothetical protein M569_01764 [Genlisea aurea]|uniref:Uncharacterized protein n=1 Tax=Genlisea aurea TaxID=192259 RepID=S8EAS8_9LAMI|nr:hypothetical protein M569_01764 [Genlisea aurea]
MAQSPYFRNKLHQMKKLNKGIDHDLRSCCLFAYGYNRRHYACDNLSSHWWGGKRSVKRR